MTKWILQGGLRGAMGVLACVCVVSCGTINHWADIIGKIGKKKQDPNASKPKVEQFVGLVDMVNPERHFVLIRYQGALAVSSGATLEARSRSGVKSKLQAGPERKQSFVTADVIEGNPQPGDKVYLVGSIPGTADPARITVQPAENTPSFTGHLAPVPASGWNQAPGAALSGPMTPGVAPSAEKPLPAPIR